MSPVCGPITSLTKLRHVDNKRWHEIDKMSLNGYPPNAITYHLQKACVYFISLEMIQIAFKTELVAFFSLKVLILPSLGVWGPLSQVQEKTLDKWTLILFIEVQV